MPTFSIITWVRFALGIWQAIAPQTKSTADDKIAAELLAALDGYQKVHGSEVTYAQLEDLRFTPRW